MYIYVRYFVWFLNETDLFLVSFLQYFTTLSWIFLSWSFNFIYLLYISLHVFYFLLVHHTNTYLAFYVAFVLHIF